MSLCVHEFGTDEKGHFYAKRLKRVTASVRQLLHQIAENIWLLDTGDCWLKAHRIDTRCPHGWVLSA